jgi:SAM-dependent methyltransferase
MDPFESFKAAQKEGWAHFAPLEALTTPVSPILIRHAGIKSGQKVLDVGCGTGVSSITAARAGAKVTALDLTPELLERARENGRIAEVDIECHEGDAEALPFGDASFDVVISQFAHMFAPRPEVAVGEMLRVLKQGGTIAFCTWPPELAVGRMFALVGRYMPPPPPGVSPPPQWGDPNIVRERLGSKVKDIVFHRANMSVPAMSVQHFRTHTERSAGPMRKLAEMLEKTDPAKLAEFRQGMEALAREYYQDNIVTQGYLVTRATKI